jgi:cytochrome c oxidase subunit II
MNLLAASTCCVNNAGSFGDGGTISDRALGVYTAVFWASVVLGVIVTALLLYAFVKFRRRSDADDPPQFHGNTRLEIAWTLVPLATFLSLFGLTAANMPFINNIHDGTQYTVTVIGQQFSWTFDYQGQKTTSGNDVQSFTTLYVPANVAVNLQVVSTDPPCVIKPIITSSSPDVATRAAALRQKVNSGTSIADAISDQGCGVNHSFYVPSLAGQVNAIPGQTNHLWLEARLGHYYGQCTELCGTGHATMLLEVVAMSQAQFDKWLQQQVAG